MHPDDMAARTALLLLPAISSTATLLYGFDQELFLRLMTLRSTYRDANSLLPAYWTRLLKRGLPRVLSYIAATTTSSLAAIYLARPLLQRQASVGWYAGAAACAAAHLAWVPFVAGPVQAMVEDEGVAIEDEEGLSNVEQQIRWLRVNMMRTMTTDLLGWVCAMVAVTKTLTVE